MGGPSAAIVVEELIALGAKTLVRIGTCGSLVDDLDLGTLLPVEAAIPADGASQAHGATERVVADPEITAAVAGAAERRPVVCVSTDLFYDPREDLPREWTEDGAAVIEMETATVLQLALQHGVRAGCLLAVTDNLDHARVRASTEEVEEMGLALGETAWAALERLGS
jgi:uridine phosphorylase